MPLTNLGPLDIIGGLLLAMFVGGLILLARFFVAYRRTGDDIGRAAARTGRWTFAIVLGAFTAGATGLLQLADITSMVFEFVVAHPFTVSNLGTIGLGWLGISGGIVITGDQYIGIALAIVGIVFIAQGVDSIGS
ncbi:MULTISPECIES: hypothetical protein [Haloarcula]|uniref:hypothetical protein n=1 Tax=Haloarcula TaxID=2237 RepID=UPI0023E8E44B|nr:hypothetical protein [Halomicroarcula sp. SHR3]